MARAGTPKIARQLLIISVLTGCLCLLLFGPQRPVYADPCTDGCDSDYYTCTSYCDSQAYDCWNSGYWNCDTERHNCYNSCDVQHNSCLGTCTGSGGGGGGGGGTPPSDGHLYCDGWDRQGDCVNAHFSGACNVIFRRQVGTGNYNGQSFLSWFQADMNGFGRFPTQDGSVGIICTDAILPGQVPLHRWSTNKGFYYSIYYTSHASDYVYGGVAAYVYPPGDPRGFPLYQFYNTKYGHFYANYKNEVRCQPQDGSGWVDQGEMARVNFPAPFAQANRPCATASPIFFPQFCDAFAVMRCQSRGGVYNHGNCMCSDGLP